MCVFSVFLVVIFFCLFGCTFLCFFCFLLSWLLFVLLVFFFVIFSRPAVSRIEPPLVDTKVHVIDMQLVGSTRLLSNEAAAP